MTRKIRSICSNIWGTRLQQVGPCAAADRQEIKISGMHGTGEVGRAAQMTKSSRPGTRALRHTLFISRRWHAQIAKRGYVSKTGTESYASTSDTTNVPTPWIHPARRSHITRGHKRIPLRRFEVSIALLGGNMSREIYFSSRTILKKVSRLQIWYGWGNIDS